MLSRFLGILCLRRQTHILLKIVGGRFHIAANLCAECSIEDDRRRVLKGDFAPELFTWEQSLRTHACVPARMRPNIRKVSIHLLHFLDLIPVFFPGKRLLAYE